MKFVLLSGPCVCGDEPTPEYVLMFNNGLTHANAVPPCTTPIAAGFITYEGPDFGYRIAGESISLGLSADPDRYEFLINQLLKQR